MQLYTYKYRCVASIVYTSFLFNIYINIRYLYFKSGTFIDYIIEYVSSVFCEVETKAR